MEALLGKTLTELQSAVLELGMPKFTAKQIAQWMYQKHVRDIDEMTNISKANRERLKEHFILGCSDPVEEHKSKDGTIKYLFRTLDGHFIETVYIPEKERATLCVSSQVGCKMNCMFCATGKQGFNGNLTACDILNQIEFREAASVGDPQRDLTNIVFMGQGEPMDNYDNVSKALEILTSDYGYAWSPRRITVSTVGLKKNLSRFLQDSECHLAVSLHFPLHEQRLMYMPAEKQYNIEELVDLLSQYDFSHQRRLSFEYIMFKGVNDSQVFAKELVKLLRGLDCRINLIPFHKIPEVDMEGTPYERMEAFRDYLTRRGLFTTIRASRGEDIEAACGLLRANYGSQAKS